MSSTGDSLIERVESSYLKLSSAASELNYVSDQLGKSISDIDAALKQLNLGVTAWVSISGDEDHMGNFWGHDLGYAKVSGKWGIAIRWITGNHGDPDGDSVEEWLFNDAARSVRLMAIKKIPELLEQLSKDAEEMSKDINQNLDEVQNVASAVKKAAEKPLRQIIAKGKTTRGIK